MLNYKLKNPQKTNNLLLITASLCFLCLNKPLYTVVVFKHVKPYNVPKTPINIIFMQIHNLYYLVFGSSRGCCLQMVWIFLTRWFLKFWIWGKVLFNHESGRLSAIWNKTETNVRLRVKKKKDQRQIKQWGQCPRQTKNCKLKYLFTRVNSIVGLSLTAQCDHQVSVQQLVQHQLLQHRLRKQQIPFPHVA